ncbi:MAG: hypothetical protein MUF51_09340 [Vicinamibacteria bacterium]|jgi:hypothetical protein|nr:hypothetical protein [Vicinamibacteria bacterium]
MKMRWFMLAVVIAVSLSAIETGAQPNVQPMTPQPDHPGNPGIGREEAYRMIDAYIIMLLQEHLALSDESFAKVLPLVRKLQADRRGLDERRGRALHELRQILKSGSATEQQLGEQLKELKAIESERFNVERKDMEALDAALTPLQQAKYRVIEVEVERKVQDLRSKARMPRAMGQGAGAMRRRGAPTPANP